MGKIHGAGVYNYHNILNMGQNQMNRNMLGPFHRSELARISLLDPLGREARPNYLRRGFCAMIFPLVVQLASFKLCDGVGFAFVDFCCCLG
ncbi:alpha/beta-Hydrolases superfamily protein [Trifolium repens]|jgi:hypothetical protein|nr:alpha/beta-Hydrolases superfamily protein [Trifolium repens]